MGINLPSSLLSSAQDSGYNVRQKTKGVRLEDENFSILAAVNGDSSLKTVPLQYSRVGAGIKAFGDDNHVIITSTKSDKHDRYLADVYYTNKKGEQHLNNRLLQEGLATRV